jgi:hypothetical protein
MNIHLRNKFKHIYLIWWIVRWTDSVAYWSKYLATDPEVGVRS